MSTTSKLETSCKDRVQVSSTCGESSANHTCGNKAVDGHGILRLLHADKPGSNPAYPCGNTLNDGTVEDRYCEVSSADIVDGGVRSTNVCLCEFNSPKNLNQTEDSDTSDDLGNSADNCFLLGHIAFNARLKMIVWAGSGITPMK